MNNLKPKFVYVTWSESPAFEENSIYSFEQFERIAETVGANHTTGGYLKTKITVIFKDGTCYEARVDLNSECLNFQQHIEQCKKNYLQVVTGDFNHEELYVKTTVALNETWKRIEFPLSA